MQIVVRTSVVALATACCASACAQTLTGTATITDADTIVIGGETIRLQGIDAPETDQVCLDNRGAYQIQNANLGALAKDKVWLSCTIILPLRAQGDAGSPVRVAIGAPSR